MPASFELTANPFNMLGVSLRARKDEIASALDDALVDPRWSEAALARARQALLVPRPRLEAELSWLPSISPASARDMVAKLSAGDFSACNQALQTMAGIDRANLAADLCCRNPRGAGYVSALVDAYSEFDSASVEKAISDNRAISGAGRLDPALVTPALAALRAVHAKAALESVKAQPSPAEAMLELANEFLHADDDNVQHILAEIAKQYDSWSEPSLRAIRDQISAETKALRDDPSTQTPIGRITELLERWDRISQPMQVIEQAKGHDEPRSRELHGELRELCIWLANTAGKHEQALAIAKALLKTFPELPSVSIDLSKDIEKLEELVAEARTHQRLKPLSDFFERLDGNLEYLAWDLVKSGFGASAIGQAKALYDAFDTCVSATAATDDADMPWMLLRHIGLKLNNEVDDSRAALALVEGIQRHPAQPSGEVANKLAEDRRTIRGNVLFGDLTGAMKGGDTPKALILIDQIIANGANGEQVVQLQKLKAQLLSRKRAAWIKAFVSLAIIGGIVAAVAFSGDSGGTYVPSNSYTPSPAASNDPSSLATKYGLDTDSQFETKPGVGTNLVLGTSEIRYCLFQRARLEYLQKRVSESLYNSFNAMVDDYNDRCSSYRYMESNMRVAQADAAAHAREIDQSAQRILDDWIRVTAPAWATPSAAPLGASVDPTAPTKDLSTPWGASQVQLRLQSLGFYKGQVDGMWGLGSKSALRAWKRSKGLPDNDTWDRATEALLME
jgi:hypothetical protein